MTHNYYLQLQYSADLKKNFGNELSPIKKVPIKTSTFEVASARLSFLQLLRHCISLWGGMNCSLPQGPSLFLAYLL